jgi:hypothetical protein
MKKTAILVLAAASVAAAQLQTKTVTISGGGAGMVQFNSSAVKGAPYSATVVNESIQTLLDGNRIVQNTSGFVARDSEGRTRQSMPLPAIGNLSAANAPQLVFIQDPVAQTAYQLNLTDKTAHKMPTPPAGGGIVTKSITAIGPLSAHIQAPGISTQTMTTSAGILGGGPVLTAQIAGPGLDSAEVHAQQEDLGTQTMQGVSATGVRTTRTIPAGQIGNDKPIEIVTEIWTSPELQTIVYSKRSDPRTGEQIFRLTNIVRTEPDVSEFAVPSDFKVDEGPEGKGNVIFYRPNE